ncbi:hypothetical protein RI129_006593 [Pyrocoelia pectoralis]|uniref:Medium-chain acyl-CoA ligase ACSF2, mitochondrial n=1 Tax=Pyrocoelia pectoralis TaxID=417401 RepID=A0AAN7ZNZ2_9COLE
MSNLVNYPKIAQTNATTHKQNDEGKMPRLSYIHNHGTEPLVYMTIGNLIERAADKYGQIEAIVSISENRRITYRDILHEADKLAAGFHRLGLRKGDKIGLWAPNVAEWVIVFFAATRIGLITVTINPKYQAPELRHVLNICEVKALVCLDEYKSLNFYGILLNLVPQLEKAETKSFSSENLPTLKIIITISKATLRYRNL